MMRKLVAALAVLGFVASACAPKVVPAPLVVAPKFADFVQPVVPPELANTAAAINQRRGWAFLQNGDVKTAEREFMAALKNNAQFYPAETALGYLELARKEPKAALPHFDRTLEQHQDDIAALMGRGQTLLALDRDAEALVAFERVIAVDPSREDVKQRVDVLRFQVAEQGIARARDAANAGQFDEAIRAYEAAITASPDSAFLFRELAAIERQRDRPDAALDHYRKAVTLDPTDAHSHVEIGEILEGRGDLEEAIREYSTAASIEPGAEIDRKLEAARSRVAYEKLPAEYRAIGQAPQVTRADLAALIGIRLGGLLQGGSRSDATLITDIRSHWAQVWIVSVARAGVMEPYANHAFQPRTLVRRADLAQAVARLLPRAASRRPPAERAWESARLRFADLAPSHLAYPAASAAVAAGVMKLGPDNSFQPSRPVTGAEALEAMARLESIAGLK